MFGRDEKKIGMIVIDHLGEGNRKQEGDAVSLMIFDI